MADDRGTASQYPIFVEQSMDDRAKFKTAYAAWVKSRGYFDAWINGVLDGKIVADHAEGHRLAEDCQLKLQAFMTAAKPFIYPR